MPDFGDKLASLVEEEISGMFESDNPTQVLSNVMSCLTTEMAKIFVAVSDGNEQDINEYHTTLLNTLRIAEQHFIAQTKYLKEGVH